MAKLIRIANQQPVILVNLNPSDTTSKEIWGKCSQEVKSFALNNLKPGDDVDIESHTEADGLHITKIGKLGSLPPGSAAPAQTPPPSTESHSQAKNTTNYRPDMSPEVSRSIRRQSVMSSTCIAVASVICQADGANKPEIVAEFIVTVFNRLLAEVEK